MEDQKSIPFSKRMRKDTREVHGISDAMINAKLALSEFFLFEPL